MRSVADHPNGVRNGPVGGGGAVDRYEKFHEARFR